MPKAKKLTKTVEQTAPDFVVVTEIMATPALLLLAKLTKYQIAPCPFTKQGMSTWALYRKPWQPNGCQWITSGKGLRSHQLSRWVHPDGRRVSLFGVHLPAPYHQDFYRIQALTSLERHAALEAADEIIAAGDFNITANKSSKFYRQILAKNWIVSHLDACHSCLGTYLYQSNWSFLDAILAYRRERGAFDHLKTQVLAWPAGSPPSDHLPLLGVLKSAP